MDRRVGWCRACACCGCPLSVYRSSVCVFYDNCHACHHSDGGHSRSRHSMVQCLASCAIHRQGTREAVMDTWDCKKEAPGSRSCEKNRPRSGARAEARRHPQAARGDLGSRGRGAHAACRPQPRAVAPRAAHHGPLPALPRLAAKVIAASATRGAAPPPDLRTRQITFFLRSIVCHPAARAGRRSEAHGARQSERSAVLCCSRPGSAALQRARCCACRARARRRNTRMRV